MTAQVSDTLLIDGYRRSIMGEPLALWLNRPKNREIRFMRRTTACSRGYVARWQVFKGRLYLSELNAAFKDGRAVQIPDIFRNYSAQYFDAEGAFDPANAGPGQYAFWVTGAMPCRIGSILNYQHSGYSSIYEKTLLLTFRRGFLTGQQIANNSLPPGRMINDEWISDADLELEGDFQAMDAGA